MRLILPMVSLLLLASACTVRQEDEAPAPAPSEDAAPQADATGSQDNPFAEGGSAAPAEAASPCPDEPGLTCAGPLHIRAVETTLARDDNSFTVRGSLRFTAGRGEAVQFAFVSENYNLRLENGAAMAASARYAMSGAPTCSSEASACMADTPDSFYLIEPGDSPTSVNFAFSSNRIEPSLVTSMPDVDQATMNIAIITIDATGTARRRDLSINVPVTARVS